MEMNEYFSRLESLIAIWLNEIETHNKSGSTDKNQYSEYISAKLLNAAFSYNLEVLGKNHPAVDLGDKKEGIAFQITSQKKKEKIESDLQTFTAQNLVSEYPQGMRFLLLVNKKPRWAPDIKAGFNSLVSDFDADRDILTLPDIVEKLKKKYLDNPEPCRELLGIMERQFRNQEGAPSEEMIRQRLRAGSRTYYEALRGLNGRFRFLKISDILLPGTNSPWLETGAQVGQIPGDLPIPAVLPFLWQFDVKHAVIFGDGGMGKTVSLIHWWEQLLDSDETLNPVPVFIALNEFNQVREINRRDFILTSVVENYGKEGGEPVTAQQVKKIMKTPLAGGQGLIPALVLLLDGFNEITVEKRELLLELIHLTEQCPGIQVVITGRRDMRADFNWSHWHPVRLNELADEQIKRYLREQGRAEPGQGRLWNLIKNPMMLTLYAATCEVREKYRDSRYCSFKPGVETPGELLWNFIEAQAALLPGKMGPGEDKVIYYWFLLKYLLPGLGFEMEKAGLFALTFSRFRHQLDKLCLRFSRGDFLDTVPQLGRYVKTLPVGECGNELDSHERAARLREIFCREMHMLVEEGETLRFLHQDFRDFFAALHILNEVEMANRKKQIPVVLKERLLDYFVRRYLGEIEGEHRSKPYLVKGEGWKIDINKDNRLHQALELCRGKFSSNDQLSKVFGGPGNFFQKGSWPPEAEGNPCYAVWNIVETWKLLRGELTGADLSRLDLSGISFNGVICSRFYDNYKGDGDGGGIVYLGADFAGSRVHEKNLLPQGHKGAVFSAVYSDDWKKILSTSDDFTTKEWDAETGECLKTMAGHLLGATSAVCSVDEKKILYASEDETIIECNAKTGECVKILEGHTDIVTSVVYSSDGKKILSVSDDRTIKEWDARTGECVRTLAGHEDKVNSAVYSSDGEKILSASDDRTIKEWDARTGECVRTLAGHEDEVTRAVYSGVGEKILSASWDDTIKEWDVETGKCVKTLAGHKSVVTSVVYSCDGKKILSASLDNTIKEWDAGTGECLKTLTGHTKEVTSAVYSKDGKKILSASEDSTI
jgi:hypothetical protein